MRPTKQDIAVVGVVALIVGMCIGIAGGVVIEKDKERDRCAHIAETVEQYHRCVEEAS